MTLNPIKALRRFRTSIFWREKLVIGFVSASLSAVMLRLLLTITAVAYPGDGMAAEILIRATQLTSGDFWLAATVATAGGLTSYFKELRAHEFRFSPLMALGHMVTAQFAGLMGYLLAVHMDLPLTFGLVICGMSGWLGNVALEALGEVTTRFIHAFRGGGVGE